ncbi:MAG: hypothetical protein ACI4WU_04885 [Bacilli bacterium]
MKNKRYKRIAKRLKGTCIKQTREYKPCMYCKLNKTCTKYLGFGSANRTSIRELRKIIKGECL